MRHGTPDLRSNGDLLLAGSNPAKNAGQESSSPPREPPDRRRRGREPPDLMSTNSPAKDGTFFVRIAFPNCPDRGRTQIEPASRRLTRETAGEK
jgi:hypothetical protein